MSIRDFINRHSKKLTIGDYEYTRMERTSHVYSDPDMYDTFKYWSVRVIDNTKESYGPIQNEIGGIPVTSLYQTFKDCTNLIEAPNLSNLTYVESMDSTFENCSSLKKPPVIPESIQAMNYTFKNCTALEEQPIIPKLNRNWAPNEKGIFDGCFTEKTTVDKVLSDNEQLSVPTTAEENNSLDEH